MTLFVETLVVAAGLFLANPVPIIEVTAPACEPETFAFDAFLAALRVELAGQTPRCCEPTVRGSAQPFRVALRVGLQVEPCTARPDQVTVVVEDPHQDRVVRRQISLSDVPPEAETRALALAVAELVRTMGNDAAPPPAPAAAVPVLETQAASSQPAPATLSPALILSTSLGVELRTYPSRDTTLWGGRGSFSVARRRWSTGLDFGALLGSARRQLGTVETQSLTAGLSLGPRFSSRSLTAAVGLRAEIGWAWIDGMPALTSVRAGSGSGIVSSVGLRLSLEGPLLRPLRGLLSIEGGTVIRGVDGHADGQIAAGIAGAYALVGLGLAYGR